MIRTSLNKSKTKVGCSPKNIYSVKNVAVSDLNIEVIFQLELRKAPEMLQLAAASATLSSC